jgi:hypothetical protein
MRKRRAQSLLKKPRFIPQLGGDLVFFLEVSRILIISGDSHLLSTASVLSPFRASAVLNFKKGRRTEGRLGSRPHSSPKRSSFRSRIQHREGQSIVCVADDSVWTEPTEKGTVSCPGFGKFLEVYGTQLPKYKIGLV